jgi:hypothetical protein
MTHLTSSDELQPESTAKDVQQTVQSIEKTLPEFIHHFARDGKLAAISAPL